VQVLGTQRRPFGTAALEMFFYWIPADEELQRAVSAVILILFTFLQG
jgi:hypothetical protein